MSDDPIQNPSLAPEQTPEPVPDPVPEPQAPPEPTAAVGTEEAEPPRRAKPSPIDRIDRLAARARAAEEAARYWQEQATAPKPEPEAPKAAAPAKPTREQYQNPDDYDAALVEWAAMSAVQRHRAETEAAETARRETEARTAEQASRREQFAKVEQDWTTRRATFAAEHPDFAEIAEADPLDGGPPITGSMAMAIKISENGPEIAYWLGQNTEEAERIAKIPDEARQMFEIARLSGRLAAGGARAPTTPPPITPLRGAAAAATRRSPEQETQEEYSARRRAERKAAGVSPW